MIEYQNGEKLLRKIMLDGVFFINSALNVKQLSVFNNVQRFEQTIETIKSVNKVCPNNRIIMFDGSYDVPSSEYVEELKSMNVEYLYTGSNPQVKQFSGVGLRSIAETLSFIIALDSYSKNKSRTKRYYKVSGRYKFNDNFILNRDEYENAFVFAHEVDSWMSKEAQEKSGVNKLFKLRLWHMDESLLDYFQSKLPMIFNDCLQYGIDVEHSYYKNLHMYKTVTVEPIGIEGVIAPTGEYINE